MQEDAQNFIIEKGYQDHLAQWKGFSAETQEQLLVGFREWPRLRLRKYYLRSSNNWLSKYLLVLWFKNRYNKYKIGIELCSSITSKVLILHLDSIRITACEQPDVDQHHGSRTRAEPRTYNETGVRVELGKGADNGQECVAYEVMAIENNKST